jgi:hypothetical protein
LKKRAEFVVVIGESIPYILEVRVNNLGERGGGRGEKGVNGENA